jgi:hypothetical protein
VQQNALSLGSIHPTMLDRTLLNLLPLLIGSAGLLTALTGFNAPQLHMAFFGENPYQLKRDIIRSVMEGIFGGLAVAALVLQLVAEIAGPSLPERLYAKGYYVVASILGVLVTAALVLALTTLGNKIATRRWRPLIIDLYREVLTRAVFIAEHEGFAQEPLEERSNFSEAQNARTQEHNLSQVNQHLDLIDRLLELPPIASRAERLLRLQIHFGPSHHAA